MESRKWGVGNSVFKVSNHFTQHPKYRFYIGLKFQKLIFFLSIQVLMELQIECQFLQENFVKFHSIFFSALETLAEPSARLLQTERAALLN